MPRHQYARPRSGPQVVAFALGFAMVISQPRGLKIRRYQRPISVSIAVADCGADSQAV